LNRLLTSFLSVLPPQQIFVGEIEGQLYALVLPSVEVAGKQNGDSGKGDSKKPDKGYLPLPAPSSSPKIPSDTSSSLSTLQNVPCKVHSSNFPACLLGQHRFLTGIFYWLLVYFF